MLTIANRLRGRIMSAGYSVSEILEEVDRLIEDMNALSAELKLMAALVERL